MITRKTGEIIHNGNSGIEGEGLVVNVDVIVGDGQLLGLII